MDNTLEQRLEEMERILAEIKGDGAPIVYNYYNCSFNYGDHGSATTRPAEVPTPDLLSPLVTNYYKST